MRIIGALTREAATADVGSQGLYWLPYLMGERTPHLDASARAAWVGLTAKHTRADLIRSVIEGVCYSQKDGLDIIEDMGVQVAFGPAIRRRSEQSVLAANDGGRLEQADRHARIAGRIGVWRGAAGLGGHRRLRFGGGMLRRRHPRGGTCSPDAANASRYAELHKIFQAIYPALKPIYGRSVVFADVALPVPLDQPFTYLLPETLRHRVKIGCATDRAVRLSQTDGRRSYTRMRRRPDGRRREALRLLDEEPVLEAAPHRARPMDRKLLLRADR